MDWYFILSVPLTAVLVIAAVYWWSEYHYATDLADMYHGQAREARADCEQLTTRVETLEHQLQVSEEARDVQTTTTMILMREHHTKLQAIREAMTGGRMTADETRTATQ